MKALSAFILIVISANGLNAKEFHKLPDQYSGTYTLQIVHTTSVHNYIEHFEDGRWQSALSKNPTINATVEYVKRDVSSKRFQKMGYKGIRIQKVGSNGKLWTYDFNKATSSCKISEGKSLDDAEFCWPDGTPDWQKEHNGTIQTTFSTYQVDLAGDFDEFSMKNEHWETEYDTITETYLPVECDSTTDSWNAGPKGMFKIAQTTYTSVEEDWIDVPDYCVE